MVAVARPEGVFSTHGPIALGALRALRDCALRTPRDIDFATFDDLTADDLLAPAVTTVMRPAYDIGFRVTGLLLDRIERVAGLDDTVTIRLSANLK